MRRACLALLVFLAAAAGSPARAEEIREFFTKVLLSHGDTFTVTERITYDFGSLQRHGIFRDIPIRYGRGSSPDYRIALDVEEVTIDDGKKVPYRLSHEGPNLHIRIGDAGRTITGEHVYQIVYRVRRGLLYFKDHDEIYWNATGNEWLVPIDRAEAQVVFPAGSEGADVDTACYTGPLGSRAVDCEVSQRRTYADFIGERPLDPREGLTIVVGLPKGIIQEPSALMKLLDRASDYLSGWFLFPVVALVGMVRLWRTRGRDPKGYDAVPVRYEPPEGLTPAELGTLVDERADLTDITATILDLAVKGYVEIEEIENTSLGLFKSKDYRLTKLKPEDAALKKHERSLLAGLFEGRDSVLVSSLKNQFYKKLPDIRSALYEELSTGGGYFPTSPESVRRMYFIAGVALLVLGHMVWFLGVSKGLLGIQAAIAVGVSGGIVLGFAPFMPRKTTRGRKAYEQILGFKEFVGRVDAGRLERMKLNDADRFEKVLPFAVVLGVAAVWAKAFAGLYTTPPSWYHSSDPTGFSTVRFVDSLGASMKSIGTTMSSRPGGSGSGLGGGGSSGGGFGGGGGGSW
jgi:hypothetical protein